MTSTTLDELWRVFGWSTNALLTGITPRQDYMQKAIDGGEWIADGLRAALIQLRGDWEFYAVSLGFPNWSKSEEMCWLCCASNIIDRLRWHNFGHDAPWRATRRSHGEYMRTKGDRAPAILRYCVPLTLGGVTVDILHAVDQGFSSHILGNIIVLCIVKRVLGGGNQGESTERLAADLKDWEKQHKTKKIAGGLDLDSPEDRLWVSKTQSQSCGYSAHDVIRITLGPNIPCGR